MQHDLHEEYAVGGARVMLDDRLTVHCGDALDVLRTMPAGAVNCIVTSPPYFGLRSYLPDGHPDKQYEHGLESTPAKYVERLVGVFREARRVLADDGTMWMNIADSYNTRNHRRDASCYVDGGKEKLRETEANNRSSRRFDASLKEKDLVGIPWLLAFALRDDGWYLRSEIIWAKPNPMPESVRDRCTKAHEYVFLLTKGQWRRRSVDLSDLVSEPLHLGAHIGGSGPAACAGKISIGLASSILDSPEVKQQLGCLPLQTKIGEYGRDSGCREAIGGLPPIHRLAAYSSWLLNADISPKEFLTEVHRTGLDLAKRDAFFIRGCNAEIPYAPGIHAYGKASVAVHDAGKISEFKVCHGQIVEHTATTCKYWYDAKAVAEPLQSEPHAPGNKKLDASRNDHDEMDKIWGLNGMRNRRSVWTIATQPFAEAHYAVMPAALAELCIKAGSRKGDVILDPFGGAGTTALAALRHGRKAVLIELSPDNCAMARRRIEREWRVPVRPDAFDAGPLFAGEPA